MSINILSKAGQAVNFLAKCMSIGEVYTWLGSSFPINGPDQTPGVYFYFNTVFYFVFFQYHPWVRVRMVLQIVLCVIKPNF